MEALSGISRVAMLRQEKFMQQPVHLQQAFPVQPDGVALGRKEAPILERLNRRGKALGRIGPELLLEIGAADVAQLELQDEFPDQPFVSTRRERAVNRQLALLNARQVRIKLVVILIMRAADVTEGSDAERQQIGPGPEAIPVN